ncbi:Epimerase domain-containing protein [Balamuthia mandrillaris]
MASDIKRVLITGSSGYVGCAIVSSLRQRFPKAEILGVDVTRPPASAPQPDEFVKRDIRSPGLSLSLMEFQPDTVIHLAFVVSPLHDTQKMHDINIGGTKNLFRAIDENPVKPARLMIASSVTAYGVFPDNPIPLTEADPIRGAKSTYDYAAHKAFLEEMTVKFAEDHSEIKVSWIRPCILVGNGLRNSITDTVLAEKFGAVPFNPAPVQLGHVSDVGAASVAILENNGTGPYNIAPKDTLTQKEIAKITGTTRITAPFWLLYLLGALLWWLHLAKLPPTALNFLKYPMVVASTKLDALGFKYEYSSKEALEAYVKEQKASSPSSSSSSRKADEESQRKKEK